MKKLKFLFVLPLFCILMMFSFVIAAAQECVDGKSGDYACSHLDLLANIPRQNLIGQPLLVTDVWGFVDLNDNREYALVGTYEGTSIVDVTDPQQPREIGRISGPASDHRDIKVYQFFNSAEGAYNAYAYVVSEAHRSGLQVINLNDLPNSVSLETTNHEFNTGHNITISNVDYATGLSNSSFLPMLYVLGSSGTPSTRVYDLVDPTNPNSVASAFHDFVETHDAVSLAITDSRASQCPSGKTPCELLITFDEDFLSIWDVSISGRPQEVSVVTYGNLGYVHSGWTSKDGMFVFIQDEADEYYFGLNTTLRTLDIADLVNPRISNVYTGVSQAIDHNGFTKGNRYYMSNYSDGLVVLDVSNSNEPLEIGYFDTEIEEQTSDLSEPRISGAWGVYPYLPSGTVLVSDIYNGLYLLADNTALGARSDRVQLAPTADGSGGGGSGGAISYLFFILLMLPLIGRSSKQLDHFKRAL